jgi:hypothetical protein
MWLTIPARLLGISDVCSVTANQRSSKPGDTQPCSHGGLAEKLYVKPKPSPVPQSIKAPENKHKPANYWLFGHPDFRYQGGEESNSLPHVQK